MSVYTMSDLHLALGVDKPMDIFGKGWSDYMQRIEDNWNNLVKSEDTVIIGGDVSWAMYLDECHRDFDYIQKLNGIKIILKGNHDYWWESITKLKKFVNDNGYDSIKFLYNNSFNWFLVFFLSTSPKSCIIEKYYLLINRKACT